MISTIDPKDYGAVGDGVTNDSAAWQTAVNTAATQKKIVVPSAGNYYFGSTVNLPETTAIVNDSHGLDGKVKISTNANIDLFNATGGNGTIEGLSFYHTGASGRSFKQNNTSSWHVKNNYFRSENNGSVGSDIIHTSGALSYYTHNAFDNFRPNVESFCIAFDKAPADVTHCIENHVESNYCGGTQTNSGPFVYIGSRVGRGTYNANTKPEGIHLVNNSTQTFNYAVVLECVLELHLIGNSFCISNGVAFLLRPTGPGIIDVRSIGNWWDSTGNPNVNAVILNDDSLKNGPAAVVKFARFEDFVYQGKYGAAFGSNASSIDFSGSTFFAIGAIGIACNGTRDVTINASFEGCPRAFSLVDGSAGGPFFIGKCSFAPGSVPELVITDKSKFIASYETSTYKLARKFTASFDTSGMSASAIGGGSYTKYINIAHGLQGTPNSDKIQITGKNIGSAAFEGVTASVISVDTTNILVAVLIFGLAVGGNVGLNVDVSV